MRSRRRAAISRARRSGSGCIGRASSRRCANWESACRNSGSSPRRSDARAEKDMNETEIHAPGAGGRLTKIHPPLLAGLLLIGGFLIHLAAGHHRRDVHVMHQFLGLILVSGGTGLCVYAAAIFATRDTTKNPYGEPSAFVVIMPYTFTRNPMYVGLTSILLGFAVFFGSPAMLLAPIIFFVVIDRAVIPNEEATM